MTDKLKKQVVFRDPEPSDGLAVWNLVNSTPRLDTNSPYYYVIWFRDFADTSVIATVDDEIVGFLSGYRRPDEQDTFVVWQEAVAPRHGIPDLGVKIFEAAAEKQIASGATFVEATVAADNKAIAMVLGRFAKSRGAKVEKDLLFPAAYFPDSHHDEILYRIGPLTSA